jgi:hypothetical protein
MGCLPLEDGEEHALQRRRTEELATLLTWSTGRERPPGRRKRAEETSPTASWACPPAISCGDEGTEGEVEDGAASLFRRHLSRPKQSDAGAGLLASILLDKLNLACLINHKTATLQAVSCLEPF